MPAQNESACSPSPGPEFKFSRQLEYASRVAQIRVGLEGSEINTIVNLHLFVGWTAMLFGAASGAVIGLFFHRVDWAGGYGSLRRRMLRLGHISFFGIGFLNFLFAMTLAQVSLPDNYVQLASAGFLVAVVAMPLNCFLTAWKEPFRHFFAVPVLAVVAGIAPILFGWPST